MVTTKTLTVSKTNIDPAFQTAEAKHCALSILYQQDGLSFLVKHQHTKQALLFGFVSREEFSEQPVDDLLDYFSELPGRIVYGIEVAHTAMVPEVMSEGLIPSWTRRVLGAPANFVDLSERLDIKFYGYLPAEDARKSRSERVVRRHNWALQMEQLPLGKQPKLAVHLYNETLFIAATSDEKWQLVNSFPCQNEAELLYHCGNIAEQLGWDRKAMRVEISGRSARDYKPVLVPYFGTVDLFAHQPWIKVSTALNEFDPIEHATLLRL